VETCQSPCSPAPKASTCFMVRLTLNYHNVPNEHKAFFLLYTGVHITGTQVRMGENNQQCVMPLVLLRAFAYLTDLMLIVSNQHHVISVSR